MQLGESMGPTLGVRLAFHASRRPPQTIPYRYSLYQHEVYLENDIYRLRGEYSQPLATILAEAAQTLRPLLGGCGDTPSLALPIKENQHRPEAYEGRFVESLELRNIHVIRYGSYVPKAE
jgi:hypothetical protein